MRDACATELTLHRRFRAARVAHGTAADLFDVPVAGAVAALLDVAEADLVRGDLIGRLPLERDRVVYLHALFRATGLTQFLDLQEAWTLSLYPSTAGGRHFTISIDRHEVAFAAPIRGEDASAFMVYLDRRVIEGRTVSRWFKTRNGHLRTGHYASARKGGCAAEWIGTMADALDFFALPMIRRALVAYWYDALLSLRDRAPAASSPASTITTRCRNSRA